MGCASSKKRTTSVDDLTGQAKNKEPSSQAVGSDKNKNGQLSNASNDVIKPIKKESSHQTSAAPPSSDTSAIQIPGTHKSFLAPDGIPFIDEDVDEDAETGGKGDANSIPVDNAAVQKPDVNKNVVKVPAVPDQKPEQPQNPAPVIEERRQDDVPPQLPVSEPPSETSPAAVVDSSLSEEQAEEARKKEVAMDILRQELDIFTSGEPSVLAATSITVTESEPVAADDTTAISQPVRAVTPDDQERAAVKIQAGIRGYRDRQRVKAIRAAKEVPADATATGSVTEADIELSDQPDEQPAISLKEIEGSQDKPVDDADPSGVTVSVECDEPNPSDVTQQEESDDDPEKQRAAVKIQASFKGYKTRKELGKIKK